MPGNPVDFYVYPGVAVKFEVLSKMTMTPLAPGDVVPPDAKTIPPPAPLAPAVAAAMAHMQQQTVAAVQAVAESVSAQEKAYLSTAPTYTLDPEGQTTGPK